jgi:hypothetical protein
MCNLKTGDKVVINPTWNGFGSMSVFTVKKIIYFKLFKQYRVQLVTGKTLFPPEMFRKAHFGERFYFLIRKQKEITNFKAGKGMGI